MEAAGIAALGLDVKALLFQVANFAILLTLLKFFAYKPLLAMLEARRQKIAESVRNADQIEQIKKNLATQQARVLAEAEQQAQALLARSQQQAKQIADDITKKAHTQAEQIITQTKIQLEQDMNAAKAQLKQETAALVVAATEKILHSKLDEKADHELVKQALQTL